MIGVRLKPWIAALIPMLLGLAIVIFAGHRKNTPNGPLLHCEFASRPNQAAVRLGNVTAPLQRFQLLGMISDRSDQQIYHFKGEASYLSDGKPRKFSAEGLVRLTDSGAVLGFHFNVGGFPNSSTEFGRDDLLVSTLGSDGYLGDDPATAYLATSAIFKTAYPTSYSCKIDGFDIHKFPPPTPSPR